MARRKTIGKVSVALGKRQSYSTPKEDTARRYRDVATGRFIAAKNAKRRKKMVSGGTVKLSVSRNYKTLANSGMVEAFYCIDVPPAVSKAHSVDYIDALVKRMKKDGHKTLPGKIGPLYRVKFFAYWEGRAISISTGRKMKGGVRIPSDNNLDRLAESAKSKTRAIYEGKSLANDPFKTTESGDMMLPTGPSLFCITAVYHSKEPVPGLD